MRSLVDIDADIARLQVERDDVRKAIPDKGEELRLAIIAYRDSLEALGATGEDAARFIAYTVMPGFVPTASRAPFIDSEAATKRARVLLGVR